MNLLRYFIVITLLALLPATSQAKWWIFGQSENEISTKYLYLNGVSYDELGDKVTVYRETLENGQIVLRGKAATSSSAVGSVQVSSNNKESWEKARKSSDGSFEYSFRPEAGKTYVLFVKIIDTTGKSNDVDATRKEIAISDQNIAALVRQAVNELITAYRAEDPTRFMALVGEDFAGDPSVLDRAIRRDFSAFDNIDITYTINNVTAATGKIFTSFSFSRKLTSTRSGQTLSDKGASEFIFTLGEKGPLVFSMKNPLIFGLSDASEVATGTVNSAENSAVIQITSSGTVLIAPVDSITNVDSDLVTGSFTLTNSCTPPCTSADGFNFTQDRPTTLIAESEIYKEDNLLFGNNSVVLTSLGASFINVTIPDTSHWQTAVNFTTEGPVFAVRLPNNTYALVKYIGLQAGGNVFEYKYQPNGSRSF
jgi:hypothetical protein